MWHSLPEVIQVVCEVYLVLDRVQDTIAEQETQSTIG